MGRRKQSLSRVVHIRPEEMVLKCEWMDCKASYTDMDEFRRHVKEHLIQYLVDHDQNQDKPDPVPTPSTSITTSDQVDQQPTLPQLPQLEQDASISLPSQAPPPSVVPAKQTQLTLGAFTFDSLKKRKMTNEKKDEIGRAITRYIVKEMQPFSTIASEPFCRVLTSLNPEYTPPNKETLSSIYIPAWYKVEVEKLRYDLAGTTGVGITADHWTSLNGDHYLTVTAHYVKDWTLMNKVLETRAVYESQTGEAIGNEIREVLYKFDISDKVVGLTVDNAANMAAGANILNVMRLPCFAHSMNVSASKLYNETSFTRWLARIRSVVLWFKRVHMAGVVLKEKLAALELPNHSVVLDVKTRWNSMYLMVERFAEIYPGLSAACRDQRLKKRVEKEKVEKITDADLKKSEEFVESMRILYTSTLAISTDKIPTVGQILPTWTKLQRHFAVNDDDSEFVKTVKSTVWSDMQKRYQDPAVLHFLEEASALDPRFKTKLQNNDVWQRVENKVADLIQAEISSQERQIKVETELPNEADTPAVDVHIESDDEKPQTSKDESVEDVKPNLKRKRSAIEELFDDDDDDMVTITHVELPPSPLVQAHLQIEKYRSTTGIKVDGNPLEFYKIHHEKFPMVAALALKYLSVSGSSVPSERVFSLAGNTISQERVRIDPGKADMLIFLHKNAD